MSGIPKTLGGKILCLTFLLTTLAFIGLFLANSYWQKQATLKDAQAGAKLTSQLLEIAIADPMRLGDNEGTAKVFATVAAGHKEIQVYLTDFKGNISYSTSRQSIRKELVSVHVGQLRDTLPGILRNGGEVSYLSYEEDRPQFIAVQAIKNAPECWHCHGKSQSILGAMVVFQDVSGQFDTLKEGQVNGAIISGCGLLLLLGSLIFFMKRVVLNKVRVIAAATEEVSKGHLDAEFTIQGTDELADLARHLGAMVSQIKDQLEYNRSVLSGIIVPILVTDSVGQINFANKPLCELLGCK